MVLVLFADEIHQVVGGPLYWVDEAVVLFRHSLRVLVFGRGQGQNVVAQELAVGGIVVLPECHDGIPEGMTEACVVAVTVLGYDGFDMLWIGESQAVRNWRAVVENVDRVARDVESGEPGADGGGEVVKGVFQVGRRLGEAEAWEVWCQDVIVGAEERDEVPVLSAR